MFKVLILGGYGTFGSRITRLLACDSEFDLVISGRRIEKAQEIADALEAEGAPARISFAVLDHETSTLGDWLANSQTNLVIHTCGPFQGQNYHVAQTCIEHGVHYVDLSDSREFVAGFGQLDAAAKTAGVLAVTGASSVPALSAAVIDEYLPEFAKLESIEISIAPGHRSPRGRATTEAVLSYCGKPLTWLFAGEHVQVHGWQDLRRATYPHAGKRWMAACDVPDLELFPRRYPDVHTVTFRAAMELNVMQLGLWLLSWPVRFGLIRSWTRLAGPLKRMTDWFDRFGTDTGAMKVLLKGRDSDDKAFGLEWDLTAYNNHGPLIPCQPAVILARKLKNGVRQQTGALPCMGLFSLRDFANAVSQFDIDWETNRKRIE